jgi:Zinc dependent phospholipase C
MPQLFARLLKTISIVTFLLMAAVDACGYSVLSHEAMVDALWDVRLKPILLARYPGSVPEALKEAHGYAYGGAIIQDMGFYPHGDGYFSDLTHYVRAGDFVAGLVRDAQSLDELAFALGALSHYAGDCEGHRVGTNVVEPKLYPKLGRKYGSVITYEQDPSKHLKSEFSFDVLEVAQGNFAPQAYHDFIGFNVATPLLERAFRETYGFELKSMFKDLPEAIGSYRRTISKLIPVATRVAWAQHQDKIQKVQPAATRKRFLFVMSRSSYERYWGKQYDPPTMGDRILAFVLKLLPPIGPLNTLRFQPLTPPLVQTFTRSFDVAIATYQRELDESANPAFTLANQNFDTGSVTPPGVYRLQDEAYAYWLDHVAQNHFQTLAPAAKNDLLSYYRNPDLAISSKEGRKQRLRILAQLDELRGMGRVRGSE